MSINSTRKIVHRFVSNQRSRDLGFLQWSGVALGHPFKAVMKTCYDPTLIKLLKILPIWTEQSFLMLIERAFQKRDPCPVLEGRGGEIPLSYSTQSFCFLASTQ